MQLPIYNITFDPDTFESGIDMIAITDNPAIEQFALKFSRSKPKIKFKFDSEQRILTGAVMIPDTPIYRNVDGNEFYVVFSKDTINKMFEKFQSEHREIKFNLDHDNNKPIKGFVKEAWIIEDPKKDKAYHYGFDLPAGTLMFSVKIEDDIMWNKVIKKMDKVGFSIEGLLGISTFSNHIKKKINKINKFKTIKMKKKRLFSKKLNFKKVYNKSLRKFEEVVADKVDEVLIIEELVVGEEVLSIDVEGDIVEPEDGVYETEEEIITIEDGVITEIEDLDEDASTEEKVVEEAEEFEEAPTEDVDEAVKANEAQMIDELIAKVLELETRIEALESADYEFKKTPKVKNKETFNRLDALMSLRK